MDVPSFCCSSFLGPGSWRVPVLMSGVAHRYLPSQLQKRKAKCDSILWSRGTRLVRSCVRPRCPLDGTYKCGAKPFSLPAGRPVAIASTASTGYSPAHRLWLRRAIDLESAGRRWWTLGPVEFLLQDLFGLTPQSWCWSLGFISGTVSRAPWRHWGEALLSQGPSASSPVLENWPSGASAQPW